MRKKAKEPAKTKTTKPNVATIMIIFNFLFFTYNATSARAIY
ncbi:hypothetical protein [[Eubacterium] cellulosolvens]